MNMKFLRKILMIILPFIIIGVIKTLNFDLAATFIYSIVEQVAKHNMIIFAFLLVSGIIGLTFKNLKTYYMFWIDIELTLCYICFASYYITNIISLKIYVGLLLLILFLFVSKRLCFIKNEIDEENISVQRGNLSPINKCDKLYSCRINQMNCLNQIIQDEISDYGCSICISGEWGCGKTSFINATLDQINTDINNKEIKKINKIHSIFINTMELDNLEALGKYFFSRVKEILNDYNVYVGVNSEYQELMNSIIGVVIHETAGNFIKNKFMENTDYRENLINLNNLINNELENSKIIIIVDDLDRCSKEKSLMFLFFIKEIAMLNRCVVIFLTDYDGLLKKCEIENNFLDKFFNYRINLCNVNGDDIIESINDNDFEIEYKKCKDFLKNKIEYINNSQKTNNISDEKFEKEKNEKINNIRESYNCFLKEWSNSRKVITIHEKFKELINLTNYNNKTNTSEYGAFINKVDYKYQIFILSILFGLYPGDYKLVETEGIYNYIYHFENDCENQNFCIEILIKNEWYNSTNYMVKEKIKFIDYLLTRPNQLLEISNSFTTLQEEYINNIKNDIKPYGINFSKIIEELLSAKFNTEKEKCDCIEKAFKLYKNDICFDDAIEMLSSNYLTHQISDEFYFLNIFYNNFCNCNLIIKNSERCIETFLYFSQHYLLFKLSYISRYILISYNDDFSRWNNIAECVFNIDNCNEMIIRYCKRAKELLNLTNNTHENAIEELNDLLKSINKYCENNGISDCSDVKGNKDKAEKAIKCFEYLLKIEEYIKSYKDNPNTLIINSENYSKSLIDILNFVKEADENKIYSHLNKITMLFQKITHLEINLSSEELNNVNSIIEIIYKKLGDPVNYLRHMYILMKQAPK